MAPWNYHVFLSFRGEDTRTNFTDHLYAALQRKGIVTFRDDQQIERGQVISKKLMKAIDESLFAIVIISQDYASSSWCLDELQQIVESKQNLTVFPVFYGVHPSDVRQQRGIIGKALEKHEGKFPDCKVSRWRTALTQVANFAGWDATNKHEAGMVENIAQAIWTKLRVKLPPNFAHLVGLESKVDTLVSLLKIELNHKCFIGIWGMGGIGKTTLARVVYEAIRDKFDTSCFLANVREDSESKGLVYLQKKFLSGLLLGNIEINDSYDGVEVIRSFSHDKKVLIVLDDVSHISQLQNLVGDKDWFGDGSIILVTTRDIHLLTAHDQFDEEYEMKMLGRGESLNLFCKHAFKMDYPQQVYWLLSKSVVDYAGGLPLALQVLGSFLCKRSISEWRDTLNNLKQQNLHKDIFEILRISYDGLDDEEYKAIFLDIACFFNREKKVEVSKILENCGLHPTIGIQVLIEKSLLSTYTKFDRQEYVHMHDLLQEIGKHIVLQESPSDASRRSRLWSREQVDQVFRGNKGSKNVQSIVLNLKQPYDANWHPNCFLKMSNLRLLYLSNVHVVHGLNSLPTALKVLIWEKYPLEAALPRNIDQLYQLVQLTLHRSRIRKLWNGRPFLGMLKFMDLSFSKELIETPDFKGVPNLERLFLEHCINLVKVHESLGQLKKLVKLSLRSCKNLMTLPRKLELNSLQDFSLYGCSKLEKLPEFGENMKCLSMFDLSGTNIRKVPSSIVHLTNLKELYLHGCNWRAWNSWSFFGYFGHLIGQFLGSPVVSKGLKLPNSFTGLSSLRKLDLSFSNLYDGAIPNDLSGLSSLMDFNLMGNNFTSLPVGCISNLVNLEQFDLSNCVELQSIPQLPPNLIRVYAGCCPSIEPLLDIKHLFESLLVYKQWSLLLNEVTFLHIPGDKIPISVFKEQKFHIDHFGKSVSITVGIPNFRYESELWGIAVCFVVKSEKAFYYCSRSHFFWRFRAVDEDERSEKPSHAFYVGKAYSIPHLYIAFFPLINYTHKFWRHLRGKSHQLELQIGVENEFSIKDCGWRLMCNKDFDVLNTSTTTRALHNNKSQELMLQ